MGFLRSVMQQELLMHNWIYLPLTYFFLSKLASTVVVYFYTTHIYLAPCSLFPLLFWFSAMLCNGSLSSPLFEDPGTHSQEGVGDSNSAIELVPWSGHLLPVSDNNRKWLTRLPSRTPLLARGNADRIVHNNTVHVRRHRVSKYTTLTKSCFVLRKQDMNPQQREKACPLFSLRLLCDQRRYKHATRTGVRS